MSVVYEGVVTQKTFPYTVLGLELTVKSRFCTYILTEAVEVSRKCCILY